MSAVSSNGGPRKIYFAGEGSINVARFLVYRGVLREVGQGLRRNHCFCRILDHGLPGCDRWEWYLFTGTFLIGIRPVLGKKFPGSPRRAIRFTELVDRRFRKVNDSVMYRARAFVLETPSSDWEGLPGVTVVDDWTANNEDTELARQGLGAVLGLVGANMRMSHEIFMAARIAYEQVRFPRVVPAAELVAESRQVEKEVRPDVERASFQLPILDGQLILPELRRWMCAWRQVSFDLAPSRRWFLGEAMDGRILVFAEVESENANGVERVFHRAIDGELVTIRTVPVTDQETVQAVLQEVYSRATARNRQYLVSSLLNDPEDWDLTESLFLTHRAV